MSTEPLTEPEILALLTREFPSPRPNCGWEKDGGAYIIWSEWTSWPSGIRGTPIGCGRVEGWWTFGWVGLFGRAPILLDAIADFRAKVAAEAAALGAVKANPTSGYNNMETAIYAAAFVAYMEHGFPDYEDFGETGWTKVATKHAIRMVDLYRATIK